MELNIIWWQEDDWYFIPTINLHVKYKTLSSWISKAMSQPPKDAKIDYQSHYQQLLTENNELKKKLKKTEVEREILKKAAAYFASQSQ